MFHQFQNGGHSGTPKLTQNTISVETVSDHFIVRLNATNEIGSLIGYEILSMDSSKSCQKKENSNGNSRYS